MTVTVAHSKIDTIADWTQADLDAEIALGNYPVGTLLADIVLPSDWNDDHTLVGVDVIERNIRNYVIIDMAGDDYVMTDTEAQSPYKLVYNVGDGTKTLYSPTSATDTIPAIHIINSEFAANTFFIDTEIPGTNQEIAAGLLSVVAFASETFTSIRQSFINVDAYGAGWIGSIKAPTQDAVYNALQTSPYTGLVSGILTGCNVTINADPTKFDISAGTYLVVDWTNQATPVITPVTFAGVTAQTVTGLATHTFTRLYLNAAGAVVQAPGGLDNPQVRRQYCVLQLLSHPNLTNISSVTTNHKHGFEAVESLIDYVKLLGPVIAGNDFSANGANLNINKSSGVFSALWVNSTIDNQDPINKTLASLTAASFTTAYQDGSGGTTFGAATTSVPVLYYDDGTGVLAALSNNKYVNLYCYVFSTNQVTLVYGQTFYSSMAAAVAGIATETFIKPAVLAQGGITTVITVKKGTTLLNDTAHASFTPYSSGNGGSSSVPTSNAVTVSCDFGASFTDKAQTVVTGEAWVTATSNISAQVITPSGVDPDEMYLLDLKPVISERVLGVGFTVTLYSRPEAKGIYEVMCTGV